MVRFLVVGGGGNSTGVGEQTTGRTISEDGVANINKFAQ